MEYSKHSVGFIGIGVGGAALLLAIVHLWAGPFSPRPSLERTVAETAVAIKDATIAALKGDEIVEERQPNRIDIDRWLQIATGVLGGLAIILGVVSFAKRESIRVASGAAILGGGAIAFQFAILALGAIVLCVLMASVISQIGFD